MNVAKVYYMGVCHSLPVAFSLFVCPLFVCSSVRLFIYSRLSLGCDGYLCVQYASSRLKLKWCRYIGS